jgi:Nucleoside 2-deoxyribosyltransferase
MPETTSPRPFVFVLMPFAPAFDDEYKLAIKPACEAAGAYGERVDEQLFHDNILERIYNQISKADLIIADVTGRSANVLYEVGYAHALDKRVIILARDASDMLFDAKHSPYIVHGGELTGLREELERRIRQALEAPETTPSAIPFDVTLGNAPLVPGIMTAVVTSAEEHLFLDVVIRNHAVRISSPVALRIGLLTPREIEEVYERVHGATDALILPSGARVHLLRHDFTLLPGSFLNVSFSTRLRQKREPGQTIGVFGVRVFSAAGVIDYPFNLARKASPS